MEKYKFSDFLVVCWSNGRSCCFVSFVLERLAEVGEEIRLTKDVKRQVERLRDELKRMQCFLKDADTKQEGDMRVRNWVFDVRNVAYDADAQTALHEMRFRSKEDSWKLFCRKTFTETIDRQCPPQLEEIGGEIVEKCAGLPLAIIVLGGLLSRKRRLSEWQRILNTIQSQFSRDPNGVSVIMALSYYDLPYYLKFCFLYLGLFPEDYLISTRKLYRLWIAEGFIPQRGERMEEIAEEYLNELIDRNMVQVARVSANERVKYCRLHNLLRDLSISKSRLEQFFTSQENQDSLILAKARHHAIYSGSIKSLDYSTQRLRSLLFFRAHHRRTRNCGIDTTDSVFFLSCLGLAFRSFKLIRVLDMEGMKLTGLPSTIGKLIHLKYLGLRDNY